MLLMYPDPRDISRPPPLPMVYLDQHCNEDHPLRKLAESPFWMRSPAIPASICRVLIYKKCDAMV